MDEEKNPLELLLNDAEVNVHNVVTSTNLSVSFNG